MAVATYFLGNPIAQIVKLKRILIVMKQNVIAPEYITFDGKLCAINVWNARVKRRKLNEIYYGSSDN